MFKISTQKKAIILLALMSFLLSACGTTSSKDSDFFASTEPAKKPKVVKKYNLKRAWRVGVGGKVRPGDAVLSPVLSANSIYVAAKNGKVQKVSAKNGKRIWSKKLKKTSISAGVGVGGGLVLVGTDKGIVYALDQETGETKWKSQLSTEVLSSPVAEGEVVVARSGDGKVYGLSSYNGEILWTISRSLPRLTLRGESRPLLHKSIVIAGFPDGTLAAVAANNGRALWDFPIAFPKGSDEIERLSDIDTTPLLVGNFIYISAYQGLTHALDIAQQRILWSREISSYHSLAYDPAYLYITDRNGIVYQLDRSTGKTNWEQKGLKFRAVSAPVALGNVVLVADGDGVLFAMDKKTGNYSGKFSFGAKNIIGESIVDDNRFIILGSDGTLYAYYLKEK